MTPEQQKIAERLDCYIVREGLSPIMNETKWRETMEALQSIPGYYVRFRVKDVQGSEPTDFWESSFPYHVPHPFKVIEWLEINPVIERHQGSLIAPEKIDFTAGVVGALQAKSIPFYQEAGVIRIQGYTRHSRPR